MKHTLSIILVGVISLLSIAATEVDLKPLKRVAAHGQNTATAGTEEIIGASTVVSSCCVNALPTNTGYVYIGDSSTSSSDGYVLAAGDPLCLDVDDPADIYYDVDTTGEGVSFICVR